VFLEFETTANAVKDLDFGTSKADDFTTSKKALTLIAVLLGHVFGRQSSKPIVVWDLFYFDGQVKEYWKEFGVDCINERLDAFDDASIPEGDWDFIVSTPCFEKKEMMKAFARCVEIHNSTNKPFILLMPEKFSKTKVFNDNYAETTKLIEIPITDLFEDADGDPITE
jgi:hypothetical protein